MRRDETLQEYTNHNFENRNNLAGVKDKDVVAYYKKGITNIKLFEKIHEAKAHTIAELMAYVDKLVDTQDAVMHDFNREDHDNGGNMSRKRSGEAYMVYPPRPSTFLEGDFNLVMDDQCQFHRDAKHTMRECEQLKRALRVPSDSKTTKNSNNDDQNGDQRFDNHNR
jgi:predicted secreted Zn-dependent protease